ncbi:MAG: transporter substrate-binding domain-containing protein [Sphaerospermopsis kisseleviana]
MSNGKNPGFSFPDGNGNLVGFDVDLSKALASALFGDTQAVEFRELDNLARFTDVANGVVDITVHQVTHNLVRDSQHGVDFTPIYFYTEQGVLTRKDNGIVNLPDLNGRKIGVSANTNSPQNLRDIFKKYDITAEIIEYTTADELTTAYLLGKVDAVSLDTPLLYAAMPFLPDPNNHHLLNANISKQPLAMVIDENQSKWGDVVRWVMRGLLQAEEYGINSENIDEFIARNTDNNPNNDDTAEIRKFLGLEGNIGQMLGLSSDWAVKMIKAVGNYGEIYQRHFDTNTLRRNQNELSANFGLQMALRLEGDNLQDGSDPVPNPQDVVFGTPNGDQLISPRDLDGIQDIVFTGAGNDEVDIPSGGSLTGDNRIFTGSGNDTIFVSNGDRAFGGSSDDKLDATDATGYRLSGGIGNDMFYLGANGRALGGEGNDQFYVQEGGGNLISGGAGADEFWIVTGDIPNTANTIVDFEMGTDVLGIRGQGDDFSFSNLTLVDNSIIVGNTTIAILRGINTTSLTADHFTFD